MNLQQGSQKNRLISAVLTGSGSTYVLLNCCTVTMLANWRWKYFQDTGAQNLDITRIRPEG